MFANVKIEQCQWFTDKTLSSDEDLKMISNDANSEIKILTSVIHNPLLNELEKKKSREQRILINYKEKKYQDALDDIHVIEHTQNSSGSLYVLKLKCMIHEQFRVARCSIMDKINNGDSTDECEAFFLRIRPDKVEKFLNEKIERMEKQNKRRKR